jgi:hypothetical protein
MTSTTSLSAAAATTTKKATEMEKILAEIRSHEKSTLFAGTSAHNPDLQMSLDAVQHKMDKCLYKKPRDFVHDMNTVFTVDADSPLASAASSFRILFQCLLDKYDMVGSRQSSSKKHRRGSSKRAKPEVFDFVAEFEEELSSGFLFEGEQFLDGGSSSDEHFFGKEDDDSSAEDFVPLSFSFEQESVLDGRSPALYSELLGEYGWTEWEDPVSDDNPTSPKTDSAGESSSPSSPLSTPSSSTATSPASGSGGSSHLSSKRGKRQRSASFRLSSTRWSKEELLFKITNELPSDKLEGIIMIVNPSLEFGDTEDEDLEFDINALDEATLYRLEDYVHACLMDTKDDQGNESMMDHHHHHVGRGAEIITITQTIEETVTTSPRKRTRTKGQGTTRSSRKTKTTTTNAQAQTLPSPVAAKKSTTRAQRRKNASPTKTKSPTAAAATTSKRAATKTTTTQVIETTICHFVEQDEDFNYIPHSRGARLNTLVPEAFEVFRTEQVIKVQKSMSDSDM